MVTELNNKAHKGPHGSILERIYNMTYELAQNADVLVRERGFSRFKTDTQTLFKVVGVTDLAAWKAKGATFNEIPPATVKKLVAGKGTATKAEVAEALPQYVGDFTYESDNGSDAVAVGVAWVLQNGIGVKKMQQKQ